jgi:hypothetical protein
LGEAAAVAAGVRGQIALVSVHRIPPPPAAGTARRGAVSRTGRREGVRRQGIGREGGRV